jgi:hypothetical protein
MSSKRILPPGVSVGAITAAHDTEENRIYLVGENDEFSVPVPEGSASDLKIRRDLIQQGVIAPVAIREYGINTVTTPYRSIDESLVNDDSPVDVGLVNEWFIGSFPFVSSSKDVLYWLESNRASKNVIKTVKNFYESFDKKHYGSVSNDRSIRMFVEALIWGSRTLFDPLTDIPIGYRGITASCQQRLANGWNNSGPVTPIELSMVKVGYQEYIQWDKVSIAELAHFVARGRQLLHLIESNTGIGGQKLTTGTVKALTNKRMTSIKQFQRVVSDDSAMSWYFLFLRMNNEHRDTKSNQQIAARQRHAKNDLLKVAATVPFDDASPYVEMGITDAEVISRAIQHDIDPELVSVLNRVP